MRLSCKTLLRFRAFATDAELGPIRDVYFDDGSWQVRYLILNSRKWLPGHRVLLTPKSVAGLDRAAKAIRFDLGFDEVKRAPSLLEHLPVTREHEVALHDFYGWPQYWLGSASLGLPPLIDLNGLQSPLPPEEVVAGASSIQSQSEPGLQSYKDLRHFTIRGADGTSDFGFVEDFVLNYLEWTLPFVTVRPKNGHTVLLPTGLIKHIDIEAKAICVTIDKEALDKYPTFARAPVPPPADKGETHVSMP